MEKLFREEAFGAHATPRIQVASYLDYGTVTVSVRLAPDRVRAAWRRGQALCPLLQVEAEGRSRHGAMSC